METVRELSLSPCRSPSSFLSLSPLYLLSIPLLHSIAYSLAYLLTQLIYSSSLSLVRLLFSLSSSLFHPPLFTSLYQPLLSRTPR